MSRVLLRSFPFVQLANLHQVPRQKAKYEDTSPKVWSNSASSPGLWHCLWFVPDKQKHLVLCAFLDGNLEDNNRINGTIMHDKIKILIATCGIAFSSAALCATVTNLQDEKLPISDLLERFTTVIEHIKNYKRCWNMS